MDPHKDVLRTLEEITWLGGLDRDRLWRLAEICTIRACDAGVDLFREGATEDNLYIVLEGRVALEIYVPHRGRVRIFTAEPQDIVGWSSVTPVVRKRTASARAVLPARLLALNAEALRELCDRDHEIGYAVMRRLADVVASRLQTTRLQLLDMFAGPAEAGVSRG